MTTFLPISTATAGAGDESTDTGGLGMLTCRRGLLPLEALRVDATVAGLDAAVVVRQSFNNPYEDSIEATYIFPLPDRAAVTSFTMTVGGRHIDGILQERGEARATYDNAIATGHRAAIAEEERPDVFTTRVGNLQPGERATIELTLAQPLPWQDKATTYRFPLVVAPRYVPGSPIEGDQVGTGTALDTDAVPDASRISPPVLLPGFPNPVQLDLQVTFASGLRPRDLEASLHTIDDQSSPGTFRLQPGERLDRDFLLRWSIGSLTNDGDDDGQPSSTNSSKTRPSVVATATYAPDTEGTEGTVTILVEPPATIATARPRDVVLVLDRSGSMGGWKMVVARRAAARIIDSLLPTDRFDVLAFDNSIERPPNSASALAPATDRNRWLAVEWLASVQARGGTEMQGPLVAAMEALAATDESPNTPSEDEREAICVLVTDGQVGNEDQILTSLSEKLSSIRMFTVGIDRAVNAGFLHRLANSGNGHCELVESEDRLDAVLAGIHHRISSPALTNVRLVGEDFSETTGEGDLFAGVALTLRARHRGAPCDVRWLASDPDGNQVGGRLEATVAESAAARPLWARARIRDLEDRFASGREPSSGGLDALADEITALSLATGVLSRFTAFVAVDRSERLDSSDPRPVVQPVEAPSGWAAPPVPFAARGIPMAAPAPASFAVGGAPMAPQSPATQPLAPPSGALPTSAASSTTGRPAEAGARGFFRRRPTGSVTTPASYPELDALLTRISTGSADRKTVRSLRRLVSRLRRQRDTPTPLLEALDALVEALADSNPFDDLLDAVRSELQQIGGGHRPTGPRSPRSFWR